MKILFIYFNRYIRPRTLLSLSVLESVLKNEGHTTKIFDTSFYSGIIDNSYANMAVSGTFKELKGLNIKIKNQDPYIDLKSTVRDFDPDIVAFTFYSINEDIHKLLLLPLKKDFPNLKIVCGGPTASINPMECFNEGYVDIVCCGEGELALVELCNKISANKQYHNIQGMWVKDENGKIHTNGVTGLTDIDNLPIQDWDSYDPIQIHGLFEGEAYRMGHVEFTRGCPYNCSYCGSGSIRKTYLDAGLKGYVRHKSPENFVNECKHLADKYKLNLFYFVDGTFTSMPRSVLRKLSKMYRERVGVPFIALVHPSTINNEVAQLLNDMGCLHVSIGIESGNRMFRKNVLNRNMTDETIVNAIRCIKKNNIHVSAYNIIGIPGMDRDHVFETIELNRMANPNSSIVSIFIPFPDAELTKKLVSMSLLNEDAIVTTGLYPTVKIKDMTDKEIMGIFRTFNLYIKLPKFTWPLIQKLEKNSLTARFIRKSIYWLFGLYRSYEIFMLKRKIRRK